MQIGIGLPNTVLDVPGRLVIDWARRAEERGFSSLATIDRVAYPNYDSLTTLTAAAAVTDRIGLVTNILLGPIYNPVTLAKTTATLDQLSGGRFTLERSRERSAATCSPPEYHSFVYTISGTPTRLWPWPPASTRK